jgi:RimJ/RimL family protein N-acetyltransferase
MNFHFIKAQNNQLPIILELLKNAAENLAQKNIPQWQFWLNPPEDKINWITQGIENQEFNFVVKENDLVGMYRLQNQDELYWGLQSEKAAYLHSLVIKPEFSGGGLGKKILQSIENQLINQNIHLLRLDCVAHNPALCQYYESQGFVKVGEKQMPHSLNNLYEKKLDKT